VNIISNIFRVFRVVMLSGIALILVCPVISAADLVEVNANDAAAQRCANLNDISVPGYDLSVVSVDYIDHPDKMPPPKRPGRAVSKDAFVPYCRLEGVYEKRTGVNGKPYAIGFAVAFPDNWNGRFLFQGGGGLNGILLEPMGALTAGDVTALFQGYAIASTDAGHKGVVFDTGFFEDQQALLNFYGQAVAKTTKLSKTLVSDYYGDAPKYSYFVGCSTGGREAMTMSQRYPDYFDGIIAGAPARTTNLSEIGDLWSAYALRQATDPGDENPFSPVEQDLIVDRLVEQCDARDGLRDRLIFDVTGCDFDPSDLICKSGEQVGQNCLSTAKVEALKAAFAGPKRANGENVYPGFYFDTGISAKPEKSIPGLLQAMGSPLGASRLSQPFDIEAELAFAKDYPLAPGNATLLNHSSFAAYGNKLMFFHGVSDPWFSAKDTEQYFQRMTAANGGHEAVSQWSQLYLVPGMGHCAGGEYALDKFNMLSALVDWVENDITPKSVIATGKAMPGVSRPLCPYPLVTHYLGRGDTNSASSFECR